MILGWRQRSLDVVDQLYWHMAHTVPLRELDVRAGIVS